MIRFPWGDLELTVLDGGTVWLDGGAMFGVVPKPLWERERAPDAQNRIRLAMNVLLIDDGKERTLVDSGAGTDWSDKERGIYRFETKSAAEILAPAGVTPEQVGRVINSHLHFDHAGGNTEKGPSGRPESAYPQAEYVMQEGEIEFARTDNERIRASYRPNCFEPLLAEGRVRRVSGETTIGPAIRLVPAPGHTPHMQMVLVVTGEGTVAFPADLVPTTSHVRYPYIMAYDLEPLRTLETKKRVLPQAAAENWRLVFEHDDRIPLATLIESGDRLVARAVEA